MNIAAVSSSNMLHCARVCTVSPQLNPKVSTTHPCAQRILETARHTATEMLHITELLTSTERENHGASSSREHLSQQHCLSLCPMASTDMH